MKEAKFKQRFEYPLNKLETKNFPAGWKGSIPDEVYDAAAKAGALEGVKSKSTAKSDGSDLGAMNVDALKKLARERGIDLNGASKKNDIIAAIEAAA